MNASEVDITKPGKEFPRMPPKTSGAASGTVDASTPPAPYSGQYPGSRANKGFSRLL